MHPSSQRSCVPRRADLIALLLMLAGLLCSTPAGAQEAAGSREWKVVETSPGRGEQCLVCRKTIGSDMNAVHMTWRGRSFAVGEPLLPEFQKSPELYLSRLQPKAALFAEPSSRPAALGSTWLWFGIYVLAGLVFGAETAYLALSRGRLPLPWFAAGLFLNVIALLIVLLLPRRQEFDAPAGIPVGLAKVPSTHAPVACVHCGSPNHPSASACSACGQELTPSFQAESART